MASISPVVPEEEIGVLGSTPKDKMVASATASRCINGAKMANPCSSWLICRMAARASSIWLCAAWRASLARSTLWLFTASKNISAADGDCDFFLHSLFFSLPMMSALRFDVDGPRGRGLALAAVLFVPACILLDFAKHVRIRRKEIVELFSRPNNTAGHHLGGRFSPPVFSARYNRGLSERRRAAPPFFEAVHVLAPRFFFHFRPLRFRHGARVLLRSFHGGQHAGLRGPFARRNRLGGRLLVARSRQRRHAFGLRGSFFQL